ncbi:MAG: S-methyl-5'-thioinosine phosphorylase [Pseudomonadota bacterium]
MALWAIIGGSASLALTRAFEPVAAPRSRYGAPSQTPRRGRVGRHEVLFLARHGEPRQVAPHLINYRANVDVLCELGVAGVVALNTVGGIAAEAQPESLFVPHQLVDYTWGREHTFSDDGWHIHADFAEPFDEGVRQRLIAAAAAAGVTVGSQAVYGCTQGPRFETAAEIERMARDGCDLVGMTGMPEAALFRERSVPYAQVSLVVNPAAGRAARPFDMAAITRAAEQGMARVERLLGAFFEVGTGG